MVPRPDGRVVLALFAAGALSFLAAYAFTELIATTATFMPS